MSQTHYFIVFMNGIQSDHIHILFFRLSLLADDDSELRYTDVSDAIFTAEQDLPTTTDSSTLDQVVNSWRPSDGIIDPDEPISERAMRIFRLFVA